MPTNLDISIMQKSLQALKDGIINGKFSGALVAALDHGSSVMQQRIFNENVDVNGDTLGGYVGKKRKVKLIKSTNRTQSKRNKAVAGQELTPYQEYRARLGRQTAKKDLELTGGTRRAIETQIEDEKSAVLQFNNIDAAKVARGQEQQITNLRNGRSGTTRGTDAVKIFSLNENEKEQVINQGAELIKNILKSK